MYSFDHDIGSFVAIGTGVVSDDGQLIASSRGVGVLKAGWHCGGNPNTSGTAGTCPQCQSCQGSGCQPDDSQPYDDGQFCTSCDGKAPGPDCCKDGSGVAKKVEDEIEITGELDLTKIATLKENIKKIADLASTATKWMPCWIGDSIEPSATASVDKGKFCCEDDKAVKEGEKVNGSAGFEFGAGCFIGLTSLAPELPANLIEALGLKVSGKVGVSGQVSDIISGCTGPQWHEKVGVDVSVTASLVFVKVGDIVGASLDGPKGTLGVSVDADNLLGNAHFSGEACIDGGMKINVEFLGLKTTVAAFNLFGKLCF
jgi:hypothetical protein